MLNNQNLDLPTYIQQGATYNALPMYRNNDDFIAVIQCVLIVEFMERYPYNQDNFGIFTKIFLPLSMPALIAQLLLWFIAGYNDYLGPMLYIGDEQYFTLQLILKLVSDNANTNLPKVMAACVAVMAPILILYLVFQEYFLKGISLSSGKED